MCTCTCLCVCVCAECVCEYERAGVRACVCYHSSQLITLSSVLKTQKEGEGEGEKEDY